MPGAWLTGVLVALSCALVGLQGVQPAYSAELDRPRRVFTISSPDITESSSLAVSTVHPGLVYTTNDSGDSDTVYVLDASTGAVVGRTTLAGVAPLDVEAIAAGSDGSLIVADIGDNDADHSSADLYRIEQPGRGDRSVSPQRVDLTYPGGPRDAESVLYDASTGRAFVVSKLLRGAKIYATPPHVFKHGNARLRPVAVAPSVATDATFLPGRHFAVIRTYFDATVYTYPGWKRVTTFPLPLQQQGESITAPRSGESVWVGSEGTRSQVLAVPLPALTEPSPASPTASAGPGSATSSAGDSTSSTSPSQDSERVVTRIFVASLIGLGLLVVVAVVLSIRARRHPSR
ncbi:MAG TPA: hypothetical protein VH419_12020 [Nocardioidaceae bacterium]